MNTPSNNCFCANYTVDPCASDTPPTNRAYAGSATSFQSVAASGEADSTDSRWQMGEACVDRESLDARLGSVYPTDLPVSQSNCPTENITIQPTHGNLVMTSDNQTILNEPYTYASNFASEECGEGTVYAEPFDPRLYDARRGQYNSLDRPPYTGSVRLKDIYSPELNRYGKDYTTYSDINAGQIQYYYSKDIAAAYSLPNFTQRSEVDRGIFKDPMGAIKPVYTRCPIKPKAMSTGCLQDIRDSTIHRESIMEGLTAKMNQRRWQSRYGNSECE